MLERTDAAPDLRVIQALFCELNGPMEIILVLNGYGGESVSQSPLMYHLFFIPTRRNLRSCLPAIGPTRAPAASQASTPSTVDLGASAGQAISACGGDARKTLNRLIAANDLLRN